MQSLSAAARCPLWAQRGHPLATIRSGEMSSPKAMASVNQAVPRNRRHGKKPHIYGSVSELTAAQNRKRVNKNSYRCGPEGCKNRGRSHPQGSAAPISSRPQLSPRSGPTLSTMNCDTRWAQKRLAFVIILDVAVMPHQR